MKKVLTFTMVFLIVTVFAQNTTDVYHRARIYYNNSDQLKLLENSGVPMDHGIRKKNTFLESDFSEHEIAIAKSLGFKVQITIEDVKSFYKNRNGFEDTIKSVRSNRNAFCVDNDIIDYQTPVNFNVFPSNQFGGYYTYSQLLQELDDMASLYPNLITTKANIGSFLTEGTPDNSTTPSIGSNGIKWVKISDNPNTSESEPQVLYTAIHHAREPASLSQLIFFMWYLLENYDSDDEVKAIVDNTELYFVPVVNPDGYLYNEKTDPQGGGLWRKNRKNTYGVDNNRNYNYYINGDSNNDVWSGPGSSSDTGSDLYHGSGPFSEIENQAMKWFVEQHNFILALNNHTSGELLYFPFSYANVATPEQSLFEEITDYMVSQNNYNNFRGSPFSGESDDFMYGTIGTHNKIYAMTPEIGTSFWPAASSIEDICKDMMFLNLSAANLAGNFATISEISSTFIASTSASADYRLKRLGLQEPGNFIVSLNPISSNIISVGSDNNHNNLAHSQELNSSISLELDPSINVGDNITYELIINNGLYDRILTVSKVFGQPAIELDELGNSISTNWTTTGWSTTSEDFVSTMSSITDSPNSNYENFEDKTITLNNSIDLSEASGAILSFQAKWDIEPNYDYVQVEISTNNGGTWTPQCGNYTNEGVSNQGNANGEPLYDGIQSDWILETIDLSDYLGQSILIRFRLVTDLSIVEDGFYFDDLKVEVFDNSLSLDENLLNSVKVYPNPVSNDLFIKTEIQDFGIEIYNIQGQLMHESKNNSINSTIDYSGFSSGLYFLNIITENSARSFKVIKQ